MPSANEKLLDATIRRTALLERYKRAEVTSLLRFLTTDVYPQILTDLSKRNLSVNRRRQLKAMAKLYRQMMQEGYALGYARTVKRLKEFSVAEAAWMTKTASRVSGVSITEASTATLHGIVTAKPFQGKLLKQWFGKLSTRAGRAVNTAIKSGVARGEAVPTIVKSVQIALKMPRHQAQAVVRTAISSISTAAREDSLKSVSRSVQWVATLDTRTSLICIGYDGKTFPINSGPRPPAHFNCRSTIVPVMRAWSEFGLKEIPPATRASMDGQVAARITYPQWLTKQSKRVQEEVSKRTGLTLEQLTSVS